MSTTIIILLAIVAIIGLIFITIYNKLVRMLNLVKKCFSGIDVQLKKRYDLIPSLTQAVAGYMRHEEATLARLTELRSVPFKQMSMEQKQELCSAMHRLSGGFTATVESYPDLKSSENVMHLQRTLNETEEQLAASRRSYNAAVEQYNNYQMSFPVNIISGMLGYQSMDFFEAYDEEREAPMAQLR